MPELNPTEEFMNTKTTSPADRSTPTPASEPRLRRAHTFRNNPGYRVTPTPEVHRGVQAPSADRAEIIAWYQFMYGKKTDAAVDDVEKVAPDTDRCRDQTEGEGEGVPGSTEMDRSRRTEPPEDEVGPRRQELHLEPALPRA